jgi:UDPglucose--hexose-1-phosphate uridylyltransferase
MSEIRKDPISGYWVIVAKNRAQRPDEFERAPVKRVATRCPFCLGHEEDTPHAVATYPASAATGGRGEWQVRVVPNKYPALITNGDAELVTDLPTALGDDVNGLAYADNIETSLHGFGTHEVIVESPEHVASLSDLSDQHAHLAFLAYRDRSSAMKADPRHVHAMVFKNVGAAAGASLEHVHSQLIATPLVPTAVQQELANSRNFFQQRGRCIFCTLIQQQLAAGTRIVAQSPRFVAFCPFASRFPYETWVLPRQHASHFDATGDDELAELSRLVRQVVRRIEAALQRPAYNYVIHSSPFDTSAADHYHWHIEIFPRITRTAGFEWGGGCFINPTPPEEAAATLRNVTLPEDFPVGKTS